jgi:hypothetical protein
MDSFTSIGSAPPPNEAQTRIACQEMSKYFNMLMATHKHYRSTDEPKTSAEWKQVSLIENFLSGIVKQLVSYEGTSELASAVLRQQSSPAVIVHDDDSAGSPRPHEPVRRFSYPMHRVGIFERGVEWEKKRLQRLAEFRQKKLESEIAPPPPRKPSKWDHVQSVMRRQRLEAEELQRKADLEAQRIQEEEDRARAELAARAAAEAQLIAAAQHDDRLIEAAIDRQKAEAARRKAEAERLAREAREEARREAERKRKEVQAAFGPKGLERRSSMPNKMVWRVNSPTGLTGNVNHEYRVKDKITGTKGISFVMGQTTETQDDVVQCVLFDNDDFDDYKAAVWWQENEHRFAAQQRKAAASAAAADAAASALHMGKPAMAALADARRALTAAAEHEAKDGGKGVGMSPGMWSLYPSVSEMPGGLHPRSSSNLSIDGKLLK